MKRNEKRGVKVKYKVVMEIEIECKNQSELKYILVESYSANEMDKVTISTKSGLLISKSLQGIKTNGGA